MASDIFRNLIEQKIDVFANTFGDSANILFKSNNKIIHPLEYGMYRERCAKELLSFTCNKNVGILDGFLISAQNHISTQCDIIMYQKDTLPIIDNGISNFLPIEVVKGIGEVKSTLNSSQLKEALLKMAKNKQMLFERHHPVGGAKEMEEKREAFSFLICNKLSFDCKELDFDEIYKDVPDIRHRHNMILSLQDGLLLYKADFDKASEIARKSFEETVGVDKVEPVIWFYPHHTVNGEQYKCEPNFIEVDGEDKYYHVIHFLNGIQSMMFLQCEYTFDIGKYLTNDAI